MSPVKPSRRRKQIRRHTQSVRTNLSKGYTHIVAIKELSMGRVPGLAEAMAQLVPLLGMMVDMMDRVDSMYGYQPPKREDSDLGIRLADREASTPPTRGVAPRG